MKEVTHEDWMKNPTPRMMWVWDSNETRKMKRKVLYFLKRNVSYPVIALDADDIGISLYKHCAEIAKTRRMTNKELSRPWLAALYGRVTAVYRTDMHKYNSARRNS